MSGNMFSLFVISVAFLAVTALPPFEIISAEYKPKPCCYPKMWQSNVFTTMGIVSLKKENKMIEIDVNSTIYFDSFSNQISEKLMVYEDGSLVMDGIVIVQVNPHGPTTLYSVWPRTKECARTTTDSFDIDTLKCVPKNATFRRTMTLGFGENSFPVQSWEYSMMETIPYPMDVRAELLVEPGRCIPILVTEHGSVHVSQPQASIISTYHSDFYPEVRDLSVFEPPKYCREDSLNNQTMIKHSVLRRFVR